MTIISNYRNELGNDEKIYKKQIHEQKHNGTKYNPEREANKLTDAKSQISCHGKLILYFRGNTVQVSYLHSSPATYVGQS